jgi:hypothetical protein
MPAFPVDSFAVTFRSDLGILIGRWLRPLPPPELQATYELMLREAQAHEGCRYWLLDLRRRPVEQVDLNGWIQEQFTPMVAANLGGALFTAYLVGPGQRSTIESLTMDNYLVEAAAFESYPSFFDDEALAVAWLSDLRERAGGR